MGIKKFKRAHHRKYCIDVIQNKFLQRNHSSLKRTRRINMDRKEQEDPTTNQSTWATWRHGQRLPPFYSTAGTSVVGSANLFSAGNCASASKKLSQMSTRQKC